MQLVVASGVLTHDVTEDDASLPASFMVDWWLMKHSRYSTVGGTGRTAVLTVKWRYWQDSCADSTVGGTGRTAVLTVQWAVLAGPLC